PSARTASPANAKLLQMHFGKVTTPRCPYRCCEHWRQAFEHRLARGRGGPATPIQLVVWLPGPSWVPALATIDDAVGPVAAVAGDALRLALDEVAAARDVNQRARNQHREQSPGADHRQPAGIYCHSLVCMGGPAARRAYMGAILTRNHVADAAASAAPK